MPKPFLLKHVLVILAAHGFFFVSQNGSHAKYRKLGKPTLTVIVPIHKKEIPFGTFRSICRQSGLDQTVFET